MTTTLMIIQAVISVLLIIVVLLQFGKGAEAGLMSGGGESFMTGAQQGNILSKATIVLSVIFMGNSILLSKIQSEKAGSSLLDNEAPIARPLNSDGEKEATKPIENSNSKEAKSNAAPQDSNSKNATEAQVKETKSKQNSKSETQKTEPSNKN